jgi:cell pole-organizing protein PopZ
MASSPQHEPTMEEILASIRKIISEDSPEAQPAAPAAAAAPVAVPVKAPEPEEAEVFELTQEVHEEPAPVMQASAPKPADDVVFETVQEAPMSAPASSNDSIFSDKTRKAVEDTFAKIDVPPPEAPRAKPSAAPSFAPVDGNSVEAVFERAVREAVGPHIDQWLDGNKEELLAGLRPLIREWMDDHFPALLEGAVRDEVARAVKARGR